MNQTIRYHEPRRATQGGAVLITAMVILLVLTLLGVTALNSTAMEQRMAGNSLTTTLAFEAAESGLASSGGASVSLSAATIVDYNFAASRSKSQVKTEFKSYSNSKRTTNSTELYGQTAFNFANFDQVSTGTASDANSVLHQGMRQLIPKE